jgi:hypothetical protein
MSGKKKSDAAKQKVVYAKDPSLHEGKLKMVGCSKSDDWNNVLANETLKTLWTKHSQGDARDRQLAAALAGLAGVCPQDELEGMMAAQLIASHHAAMECYRRAMLAEQTFEGRRESLSQANNLSRTHVLLVEALNRHRGKGQQKVTVEHVHVHAGGQAIVGAVSSGEGSHPNQRNTLMKSKLPMHLSPRCEARTKSKGNPCQSPAMPTGRCRMLAGSRRGPRWEIERVQTWSLYRTGARTTAGAFENASAHQGCRGSGKRVGGGN